MTRQRRDSLNAAGVRLGAYVPDDSFVARLEQADATALAGMGFIRWIGPYEINWKRCPNIGRAPLVSPSRRRLEEAGKKLLIVSLFDGVDVEAAMQLVRGCGATLAARSDAGDSCRLIVEAPWRAIDALCGLNEVMFVEEAPEAQPRNQSTSWISQSNVAGSNPLWNAGLHGEGQIIGIIDWDMRADHCSFDDPINSIGPLHRKIVAYYGMGINPGNGYHGTRVACTAAGFEEAQTNSALKGMAYQAKIVFQHFNGVLDGGVLMANDRLTVAHDDGARVHSNSWGNNDFFYNAWARDIDLFTRNNEDDLVLVAVINAGQVKAPENAKNCLGVAASRDTPSQASHCKGGAGPTQDGRQKPEVFAPGCGSQSADVNTTCGSDDTGADGGTSYATPAVAGMASLTRQYFMEGFFPLGAANGANAFTPSGALLKAVIVNSAVNMNGMAGYFTASEGWGRVLMDDALYFAGDARKLLLEDVRHAAGLSTGESASYYVEVGAAATPLKITLVWTDEPAAIMAASTPVNNLNLVATDPVGTVYLGNVFGASQSNVGGSADILNNAEQVHRTSPTAGLWRIDVVGAAVNGGDQGYALAVTGDVGCLKGDVNADGLRNAADIAAFIEAILGGGGFFQICAADLDVTGAADVDDVDEFVTTILAAGP